MEEKFERRVALHSHLAALPGYDSVGAVDDYMHVTEFHRATQELVLKMHAEFLSTFSFPIIGAC